MKKTENLIFRFIEGNELMNGKVNVIVADGLLEMLFKNSRRDC